MVTLDDISGVKTWSVDSGAPLVGFFAEPGFEGSNPEDARVSAICFDDDQRRMFTGSAVGIMRTWNYNSGNVLMELGSTPREMEITHVHYMEEGENPLDPSPLPTHPCGPACMWRWHGLLRGGRGSPLWCN